MGEYGDEDYIHDLKGQQFEYFIYSDPWLPYTHPIPSSPLCSKTQPVNEAGKSTFSWLSTLLLPSWCQGFMP
jgi:hypothetical protein